jgi:hypothetical protein
MAKTKREEVQDEIISTVDDMVLAMLKQQREAGTALSAAMLAELTKRYGTRPSTGNPFVDGDEGDIEIAGVINSAEEG